MSRNAADTKIREQKDLISQLNMTINSQNELIASCAALWKNAIPRLPDFVGRWSILPESFSALPAKRQKEWRDS